MRRSELHGDGAQCPLAATPLRKAYLKQRLAHPKELLRGPFVGRSG
jgi:hypothetical protein